MTLFLDGTFVLVVAVPLVAWLARRSNSRVWRGVAILTVVYGALAIALALFPIPLARAGTEAMPLCANSCNLVPSLTIRMQLAQLDEPGVARQLVGNIALLLPLGITLPVLVTGMRRWPAALLTIVLLGAAIEAAQVLIDLATGAMVRSLDVDDALLNGLGVSIGFALWWLCDRVGRRLRPRSVRASGTSSALPSGPRP